MNKYKNRVFETHFYLFSFKIHSYFSLLTILHPFHLSSPPLKITHTQHTSFPPYQLSWKLKKVSLDIKVNHLIFTHYLFRFSWYYSIFSFIKLCFRLYIVIECCIMGFIGMMSLFFCIMSFIGESMLLFGWCFFLFCVIFFWLFDRS